ncbi:hypothetical protein [Sphingobacterium faecale]|uniref:Uncharacterized protein n=1 Tax=Sphingobacterium faecale TaxID=2803775 RepID=A0ABS1R961_9SPHI|nr:hypothetical protein [Sphingobacterium faecale]MBL1411074.1 hypothetical protein [Sphingobacterium faecale]
MNRLLKLLFILLGIALFIIGGFYLFLHIAFDGLFTGVSYDKRDLIENYEKRKEEIIDVRNYFTSILPEGTDVMLEFNNNNELGIFHVTVDSIHQSNWNLEINSLKVDSLLNEINWTKEKLKILKEKLDKANCISIAGRDPVVIGWQRSGMGLFSYVLFNQNLNEDMIKDYNDGCSYIFYKDNIVLKYGGGAIGIQCFPDFYKVKSEK